MIKDRIKTANKEIKADLVIRNITILDVFNLECFISDIAIKDGYFVGIGDFSGCGINEVDGTGKTMVPGFVDAHVHIESSMVTPIQYSNTVLPFGVTSVIADPHEIANVSGIKGIEYMIDTAKQVPLDVFFMLPSCVPATHLDVGGATFTADELQVLYQQDSVLGLGEVMNFPSVLSCEEDMLKKIHDAKKEKYTVDGHCAGFDVDQLNAYATAGITTDHEATSVNDLIERNRRGIHTLVRQGTVCKDLLNMLPGINERNFRLLCFATDDMHLDELIEYGGVKNNVKLAIAGGLDPAIAITMATYNTCQCYKLHDRGAIAPGYKADFSIVDSIEHLNIFDVYKNGELVVKNQSLIKKVEVSAIKNPVALTSSIKIPKLNKEDLMIDMKGHDKANIIQTMKDGVVTKKVIETVEVDKNGYFVANAKKDQQKIIVIERHKNTGNIGKGILKGLKLDSGAIATTISHDSHNLIVVGTNDEDVLTAIEAIKAMQGGIVVVNQHKVLAKLSLEICGLISARQSNLIVEEINQLNQAIKTIAPKVACNPLLTLSFMSLVVIPEIKICSSGLFDFSTFNFIDIYSR